jgi:hypothetical protein
MLNGVRIYTSDKIWRQILADFGATVTDVPAVTDINFDKFKIADTISPLQLKSLILSAVDNSDLLYNLFGKSVSLPDLQARIVVLLSKTGGVSYTDLKSMLGFMPGVATHTIDTAIYQLRQKFGREFIENINGVYKIGKL